MPRDRRSGPELAAGDHDGRAADLDALEPFPAEAALLRALGVTRSGLPVEMYVNGPRHVFVTLPTEADVAGLSPDLAAVARLPLTVASCVAGHGRRWKSRAFGPAAGVPEHPATGSAAGPLAWHLTRHGRIGFGDEIEISQGVEMGRPSRLHARVHGTGERLERVEVGGSAVVVARGEFRV